jgi:hypothetical protein
MRAFLQVNCKTHMMETATVRQVRALQRWEKLRIVTLGFRVGDRSRGRYATLAISLNTMVPRTAWLRVRRWGLGFVHRSRAILCRAVPNRSVTIRNCFIAVRQPPASGSTPRQGGRFARQ